VLILAFVYSQLASQEIKKQQEEHASVILSLVKNSLSALILAFVYSQLMSQERKGKQQEHA
jgi:hypothetical protein